MEEFRIKCLHFVVVLVLSFRVKDTLWFLRRRIWVWRADLRFPCIFRNMEAREHGDGWYFNKEKNDKFSLWRLDGINAKTNLWKSYCTFIKDIWPTLK